MVEGGLVPCQVLACEGCPLQVACRVRPALGVALTKQPRGAKREPGTGTKRRTASTAAGFSPSCARTPWRTAGYRLAGPPPSGTRRLHRQ